MATVNKDFRIKAGLVVEGANATVNGEDIITTGSSTDNLPEGTTNLYFTPERAANAVADEISTAVSTAVDALTTDVIEEGTTNKYFTNQRALDATSSAYDASGAAATAEQNAKDYTDLLIGDPTIDGSGPNTVSEKISMAALTAENNAIFTAQSGSNAYTRDLIGDITVDGTTGNTVTDRIATAEQNANDYTDAAIAALPPVDFTGYATETYVNNAVSTAQQNAENYADGLINDASNSSTEVWSAYKTSTEIGLAEADAKAYADGLAVNYDAAGAAATALTDAKAYTDQEVAALVDGAPALLDTLNELAAAIADNPNYATDVANLVAGKQDIVTGVSDTEIGYLANVTSDIQEQLDGKLTSGSAGIGNLFDVADGASMIAGNGDVLTWDGANGWTASGVASQVTLPTNTSIGNVSSTEIGYLNGVTSNVQDQIDDKASTTYVDTNFVNVADLPGQLGDYVPLTQKGANDGVATLDSTGNVPLSQLGNVPDALITSVGTNLDVTAGELTISDTPTFTSVDINSLAKQVAATISVSTAATVDGIKWAKADYRSAKLLVKAKTASHTQVSEIILSLDGSDNVAITEFGIVYTDGELATVSADVSGSDVRVRVTTLFASTDVSVVGTLLV